jgi:carboxyl-terminal processing protease
MSVQIGDIMVKLHSKIKSKIVKHINKKKLNNELKQLKQKQSAILFIGAAFVAFLGYMAGTYHFQIEAAVGPVFGFKAHSGEIDLKSLQSTYGQLASHFDGELDMDALIQGANRGMVAAAGDNYTTYFSPEEAIDFNDSLNGNIGGGIGAEIGIRNDKIVIVRPLNDNPAIKAGLQANDVILSVNDQAVADWTVERTVNLIRGDAGTTVKIKIQRDGEEKDFIVTRAIINNPSVESSVVGTLGTITITRFDSETGVLAKTAAQELIKKGVKSVILDLRGNGGGYVSTAVDVAGLWLDNKVVVTERSGDKVTESLRSGSNPILSGLSTVVLVDGGTASASEIVAGALQDYKVAKLVGQRTFGKGSVQLPIKLDGGAELKVTVAKWYTPNGNNIAKDGITPDVISSIDQSDVNNGKDPQMYMAKTTLEL